MNKDKIVLSFVSCDEISADTSFDVQSDKMRSSGMRSFEVKEVFDKTPIGFQDINSFIEGRKASSHNQDLNAIMKRYGWDDSIEFIRVTHANSINDTFWIKSDHERINWMDVSLYNNPFTKVISRLAYEDDGLYEEVISAISPELVTDGSFPKCFCRENNEIYIYKRGTEGAMNAGKEPYCEHMASEIAAMICDDHIPYELVTFRGKTATKCKLFTDENTGYASCAKFFGQGIKFSQKESSCKSFDELEPYAKIGAEEAYREMIVLDAIVFNEDRHRGNYGVLFNTDTLQIRKMAPIFDLNMSLLFSFIPKDFECLGDNLLKIGPRIGKDFLQAGQDALTDGIRNKVKQLKDFRFSFQGDDFFPHERVKMLEEIVQKQAAAILSKERLSTKDVFIPEHPERMEEKTKIMRKLLPLAEEICDELEKSDEILRYGYMVSYTADSDHMLVFLEAEDPKENTVFQIDMLADKIDYLKKGKQVTSITPALPEMPGLQGWEKEIMLRCEAVYEKVFPKEKRKKLSTV